MLATHVDAERRYDKLRNMALKATEETLQEQKINNIRLTTITLEALNATKLWERSSIRQVNWNWLDGHSSFKFRYPKRFEIALWQANQLIGLSMGKPTYSGTALRLDVIEAAPSDLGNRPSIFEMVILAYGVYARLINAKQIRIMNPINDQVKAYYQTFGYTYVAKGDYLYMDIL
jgi:hypothetical protein